MEQPDIFNAVIARLIKEYGAEDFKLLCVALSGSHAYSLNDTNSDKDYTAIYLPPVDTLIGIKNSENIDLKLPGSDIQILSFPLWYQQLMKSNFNAIERLWYDTIIFNDELYWPWLIRERNKFFSKRIFNIRFGLIDSLQKKYEAKAAYHLIRTLDTLIDFAKDPSILRINRTGQTIIPLLFKSANWRDWKNLEPYIAEREIALSILLPNLQLKELPDYDFLNRFKVYFLKEYINGMS